MATTGPRRDVPPSGCAARPTAAAQPTPRLLLKVEEAAQALGISRTALYELLRSGDIYSVHIGRSVRVPVAALDEYVMRLTNETKGLT